MQQRGDDLILVAAPLPDDRGDRQRVGDVGDCGPLAPLEGVDARGVE
jgi:hypothetical protein